MTDTYHFIGIGGIGMSGLARILLDQGKEVSGSDIASTPITKELSSKGAKIFQGQSASNISPSMTVIFSTDIKKENPEYATAVALRCRMMHRSELLQRLMEEKQPIAVTGTHGKTTTSAMLAWVLHQSGKDPSFAVGGTIPGFDCNGKSGDGDFFVAEADESDGSFLRYQPYGAIVTNIGIDHMNHYRTERQLIASFGQFMGQVKNSKLLFWCGDDARLNRLGCAGVTYGFSDHCDVRCSNYRQKGWNSCFDIHFEGRSYSSIETSLIGRHNALNAAGVFGIALSLGASEENIRSALKSFGGVGRRCEKKGEWRSALFLDDYAHHPSEIQATLSAIRCAVPGRRLIAVFQPHRYTRTRDCMGLFGPAFCDADQLVITDIHSAGERSIPGIDSGEVLKEIQLHTNLSGRYVPREDLAEEMIRLISPEDVVVTLGAGNITKACDEILFLLKDPS